MNIKKIFSLLVLAIILIAPVSAVSVNFNDELGEAFNDDTVITIDDVEFIIPKGYYDMGDADFSEDAGLFEGAESKIYANDDDSIAVAVVSNLLGYSDDDLDEVRNENTTDKTINGHEGVYSENEDGYLFVYVDDDKVVFISGVDNNQLEKIIKN